MQNYIFTFWVLSDQIYIFIVVDFPTLSNPTDKKMIYSTTST